MSTKSYVINFTDPTKTTITVPAGDSFGPYSNTRFTDIELLGMGHTFWGEKTNENILHMLENFASNEDLHPIASVSTPDTFVVAGRDVTKSFVALSNIEIVGSANNDATHSVASSNFNGTDTTVVISGVIDAVAPLGSAGAPGVPDKSSEFSPITAITGQLWYNQTTGKLLTFNQTGSPLTAGIGDWKPLNNFTVSTTAPTSASEGDFWWDSTTYGTGTEFYGRNLKIYISGTWEFVVQDYLPRNGSKPMTGILNMDSNKITNVGNGSVGTDAINLAQADNLYVNLAGDIMTGPLTMQATTIDMTNNKIVNVQTPTNSGDALNFGTAQNLFFQRTGGTLFGDISLNFTNKITNVATATNPGDALNLGTADGKYLAKAGGTMTGALTLSSDPTTNLHAATKQYVDNTTVGGISTINNPTNYSMALTTNRNAWTVVSNGIPAGANYVMIVADCYHIVFSSSGTTSFEIHARELNQSGSSAFGQWKFVNAGGDTSNGGATYRISTGSTIVKVTSGVIELQGYQPTSGTIAPSASYRIVAAW